MRKAVFFLLLLLLASACKKSIEYETLASHWPVFEQVYAIKDSTPDSALMLMQRIADTMDVDALGKQSTFLLSEYQVLRTEVLYKNYALRREDTIAFEAFRFYDSVMPGTAGYDFPEDLCFQKARSYYYKAVVEERITKQHIQAFSDYLNALWLMDGLMGTRRAIPSISKTNSEYAHFTGLIYDRLAWFLYTYDAWDTSLECLEKSSDCYELEGFDLGVASNYELMGDVMLAQGDREGSMEYYKSSDSIHALLHTDDIYQHFSSLIHQAIDLYNTGEKEMTLELLQHALTMSDKASLKRQVHFSLGYFYYESHQYDSALFHYEQCYPLLPRQNVKSYCRIIKSANMLGDSLKAAHYGELLSDFYMGQVAKSGDKNRMIVLYDAFKSNEKDMRQKDIWLFVTWIVAMALLILGLVILILERRRRHHKREIQERERVEAQLLNEIEATKNDTQQKEEKIKALQSKLDRVISNPDFQSLPFDKKLLTLSELPISKRVLKVKDVNVKAFASYPELVLSDNHMTMLVNAVDAVFPKFSVRIIERYPRLKRSDVIYCCMYILGVSEAEAAALTGKTYQAVWTRSVKLHEIFDNKSNLQFVLHDMLKNW